MEISPSANSVDVSIDTWNTSDTHYKRWTESSVSPATITTHTVGDLQAGRYYQVKADDSVIEPLLQADEIGEISFTYSGGYTNPVTLTVSLSGDFNGDYRVDFYDLDELANRWLNACSEPNWCGGTDADCSSYVDFIDFVVFTKNWF
jgi:hypothetical protein